MAGRSNQLLVARLIFEGKKGGGGEGAGGGREKGVTSISKKLSDVQRPPTREAGGPMGNFLLLIKVTSFGPFGPFSRNLNVASQLRTDSRIRVSIFKRLSRPLPLLTLAESKRRLDETARVKRSDVAGGYFDRRIF